MVGFVAAIMLVAFFVYRLCQLMVLLLLLLLVLLLFAFRVRASLEAAVSSKTHTVSCCG